MLRSVLAVSIVVAAVASGQLTWAPFIDQKQLLTMLDVITYLGNRVPYQQAQTIFGQTHSSTDQQLRAQIFYDMSDWASSFGYPLENYYVQTDDGYILQVFRIPHGRNATVHNNGTVIFLQHGAGATSEDWLYQGANSIGFWLADLGYDVWLGNYRGNFYSRNHTTLNPDTNSSFWDFCYDQHGKSDLPAMIDFVLQKTGDDKLLYMGHSMGTTGAYVMLSERPEYNDKLIGFIPLASIVTTRYAQSGIQSLDLGLQVIQQVIEYFDETSFSGETGRRTNFTNLMYSSLCPASNTILCQIFSTVVEGLMVDELYDKRRYGLNTMQGLEGSSIRVGLHYIQSAFSREFAKFDFGATKNQQIYQQATPPEYDVSKITTPVIAFWSDNDILASLLDQMILFARLPNLVAHTRIDHVCYTHANFLDSLENQQLLYPLLLNAIQTLTA